MPPMVTVLLYYLQYFLAFRLVAAENGRAAWLRYAPLTSDVKHPSLPSAIVALNSSQISPVFTAGTELQKGIQGIFDKNVTVSNSAKQNKTSGIVVVGTEAEYKTIFGDSPVKKALESDGFFLSVQGSTVKILGQNERGALYGAFEYLSLLATGNFSNVEYVTNPDSVVRWINSCK
jgi:alpha-glucuronidase